MDKVKRLADISDEVREFHPVLQKLLPRLPGVQVVEYTHGTRERGADFVLERLDSALGIIVHTGVIAKIGSINASEVTKIQTQIEECSIERTFQCGKKRVRISEIWIVTSGIVSTNARELINDKYATRSVQYLDRDHVIRLLDSHFPAYWTELDITIGDYLTDLVASVNEMEKALTLLPDIEPDFYVEQNIFRTTDILHFSNGVTRERPQRISLCDELASNRLILVEGDAGTGKSKLLRHTARQLAEPTTFLRERMVPVMFTAAELITREQSRIDDLVMSRFGTNRALLDDDRNILLLFVDGFDELKLSAAALDESLEKVARWAQSAPRRHVVVTTRSSSFDDQTAKNIKSWHRLELFPLTNAQLFRFIKHVCKNIKESNRLFEDIKDSPILRELPRSPIAALLLADILKQKVDELPSTLPELYAKYFEVTLGRWEIKKGLQSQKEYEALDAVLMGLARYMIENQLDQLSIEEARQHFIDYLSQRNLGIASADLVTKLRDRFEIISINEAKGTFRFRHKTFAEFLYAKSLIAEGNLPVSERVFELYWINSVYFYVGLRRDCPKLIQTLATITPKNEFGRWIKVDAMANYLLAAYATPYVSVSNALKAVVLEAAALCKEALVDGKSILATKLSPMYFLWMFQHTFKQSYGYKFFERAIEDAALDIGSAEIDPDTKAFALFLLDTTNNMIGGRQSFGFLLKDEALRMPVLVQLGVLHESESFKKKDAAVRKFDRKVRKMIRSVGKGQTNVSSLYDLPISEALARANRAALKDSS